MGRLTAKEYFNKIISEYGDLVDYTGLPRDYKIPKKGTFEYSVSYELLGNLYRDLKATAANSRALIAEDLINQNIAAQYMAEEENKSFLRDSEIKDAEDFFRNPSNERKLQLQNVPVHDILDLITMQDGFNLLVNTGSKYYTINRTNLTAAMDALTNNLLEVDNIGGSDGVVGEIIYDQEPKDVKFIWKAQIRAAPTGGYFKYYNKLTKVDLSRYGIYHNYTETNNYELNCLEIALKNGGIDDKKFNKIKTLIKTRYVPQKDLKVIAEGTDIHIHLNTIRSNGRSDTNHYNKNASTTIKIGLVDEHYFLIEDTIYTSSSIENYFEICDKSNFNSLTKNGNRFTTSNRFVNSFSIIKTLLENVETHLQEITLSNCGGSTQYLPKCFDYKELYEIDEKTESIPCEYFELMPPSIFTDCSNEVKIINGEMIQNPPILNLDNFSEDYFKKVSQKEPKKCVSFNYLFFDTETTTNGEIHLPYMLCSENDSGSKSSFIGKNCILEWLQSLTTNYICIAHNLRYDLQFVIKYLADVCDMVKTGNSIKSISGKFYNRNTNKMILLNFKDSYGMITMPLKKFGDCFKLKVKKEIMPYSIYTNETVGLRSIPFANAKIELSEEDYNGFLRNIEEWNLKTSETEFNHIEYARIYCEMDVTVLKTGYNIFHEWMSAVTGLNINYAVSIPQVSYTYGLKEGVFNKCNKISGVARDFIQRCVVGGRCMTSENKKFKINHNVDDFDGVSLYPSAMNRMDGFLCGNPKVITPAIAENIKNNILINNESKFNPQLPYEAFEYDKLKYILENKQKYSDLLKPNKDKKYNTLEIIEKYFNKAICSNGIGFVNVEYFQIDGYFVEIEILDIPHKRKFPLLSRKNEAGIRQFSNEIRGRGVYVDKYGLEDLIKYHELKSADFNIIRGYFYDQGRNTKIKSFMQNLFDERALKKKEKNPVQEVYKLIMNAFYGKTIMKPINDKYDFIYGKDKMDKFLSYKFNSIKEFDAISSGMFCVKSEKSIIDHFSLPHIGVEVLSMSKRIMNEVMCVAEDNNIEIYYQDTDSMHIDARKDENGIDGVTKLTNIFREQYGKELVGKNLGQFHSDFSTKKAKNPESIISVESVYVGKKTYCDKLEVKYYDENKEEKIVYDFHSRMKGIPEKCILNKSELLYNNNTLAMYDDLLSGKAIEFDLLEVCKFAFKNNFTTINNKIFKRVLKF
jgi:hypothetical protein